MELPPESDLSITMVSVEGCVDLRKSENTSERMIPNKMRKVNEGQITVVEPRTKGAMTVSQLDKPRLKTDHQRPKARGGFTTIRRGKSRGAMLRDQKKETRGSGGCTSTATRDL